MLRISLFISALILSSAFFTQSEDFDTTKRYRPLFGFNIGANLSALYNSDATDELQIENAPGFRLGVLAEFPISEKWSIIPRGELSFNYARVTEDNVTYKVDPNNLDFMTHFKYRFKGYEGKARPYMLFGPNIRVPLKSEVGEAYETKTSLAADFAFGVQIDASHFFISPELRFSGGLTDIRKTPSGKMLRGSNVAFVLVFTGK